jgi:hypothetical protein
MSGVIDMNDPEVVESLKYLVVTKEERIKLQSQPFDAKKACWVPDPKEGFLAGEIQSTKGDDVTVKTSKGEVIFLLIRNLLKVEKKAIFSCY